MWNEREKVFASSEDVVDDITEFELMIKKEQRFVKIIEANATLNEIFAAGCCQYFSVLPFSSLASQNV